MKVLLINFSYFAETLGFSEKIIETKAKTAAELYEEQKKIYQFFYNKEDCQIAINDCLVSWDTSLKQGDKITFLSPFSGG